MDEGALRSREEQETLADLADRFGTRAANEYYSIALGLDSSPIAGEGATAGPSKEKGVDPSERPAPLEGELPRKSKAELSALSKTLRTDTRKGGNSDMAEVRDILVVIASDLAEMSSRLVQTEASVTALSGRISTLEKTVKVEQAEVATATREVESRMVSLEREVRLTRSGMVTVTERVAAIAEEIGIGSAKADKGITETRPGPIVRGWKGERDILSDSGTEIPEEPLTPRVGASGLSIPPETTKARPRALPLPPLF